MQSGWSRSPLKRCLSSSTLDTFTWISAPLKRVRAWFESKSGHQFLRDSSVVERRSHKPNVGGPIPPPATNFLHGSGERRALIKRGERPDWLQRPGSTPGWRTNQYPVRRTRRRRYERFRGKFDSCTGYQFSPGRRTRLVPSEGTLRLFNSVSGDHFALQA
jgi:hypothetical protein